MKTFDSNSKTWSVRESRTGRFAPAAEAAAQAADRAVAATSTRTGWVGTHATADAGDVEADVRGFFGVVTATPRPTRVARVRAAQSAKAWGFR